jgi:hypothetical protein
MLTRGNIGTTGLHRIMPIAAKLLTFLIAAFLSRLITLPEIAVPVSQAALPRGAGNFHMLSLSPRYCVHAGFVRRERDSNVRSGQGN